MKKTAIFLLATFALAACERGEVEMPTFDVSVASTVVKAGTSVDFAITGYSDIISFYSGELGNEYDHRLDNRLLENAMHISFGTIRSFGENPTNIQLLWSSDFHGMDGAYTMDDVAPENSTWHDISDHFKWPTVTADGVTIPAGNYDMTSLFPDEETPIYLAFRYKALANEGICAYFNIQNFQILGVTPIGSETVYTFSDCNWQLAFDVDSYNEFTSAYYPDINTKRILLRARKNKAPTIDKEAWAIGGPFYKQASIDMGPDRAVAIKANSDPMPSVYQYAFETPGDYTVTFIGRNASVYGHKEVVREVRIKVVDDAGSVVSPSEGEWND